MSRTCYTGVRNGRVGGSIRRAVREKSQGTTTAGNQTMRPVVMHKGGKKYRYASVRDIVRALGLSEHRLRQALKANESPLATEQRLLDGVLYEYENQMW